MTIAELLAGAQVWVEQLTGQVSHDSPERALDIRSLHVATLPPTRVNSHTSQQSR